VSDGSKTKSLQVPVLPLNYEDDGLAAMSKYQIATLSLRLEFRSSSLDEEWLASRSIMNKLQDGLFDMNIELFNVRGDLVATSTQTWSLRPSSGPKTGHDNKQTKL
jgi:hypothetical protein